MNLVVGWTFAYGWREFHLGPMEVRETCFIGPSQAFHLIYSIYMLGKDSLMTFYYCLYFCLRRLNDVTYKLA